jgi:hypothetical protein
MAEKVRRAVGEVAEVPRPCAQSRSDESEVVSAGQRARMRARGPISPGKGWGGVNFQG